MPLKHLTETILVVLLAAVTIVTGVVVSTLPHIPDGFFPWVGVFAATIIFPALLYPTLKKNRADYSFRALHFAPVTIALGWLFIEIILLKAPNLSIIHDIYTWGWSALAVVVAFVLLAIFCLQVIRRRVPRLSFLTLLLVPFLAIAYASEAGTQWNTELASLLWNMEPKPIEIAQESSSSHSLLASSSKGEKNLSTSSVPEEESWRAKLRAVEEGNAYLSVRSSLKGVKATIGLVDAGTGKVVTGTTIVMHRRKHLPRSGGEVEALGILCIAAFAATLHRRARLLLA